MFFTLFFFYNQKQKESDDSKTGYNQRGSVTEGLALLRIFCSFYFSNFLLLLLFTLYLYFYFFVIFFFFFLFFCFITIFALAVLCERVLWSSFDKASPMADITHHPMDQLQDLEYCIDSNPPWGMPSLFVYVCFVRGSFLSLTFFFIWLRNFESEMGLWDNIYSCKVVFFFFPLSLSLSIQCFFFFLLLLHMGLLGYGVEEKWVVGIEVVAVKL